MDKFPLFAGFFKGDALRFLYRVIDLSLEEDEEDLTTNAVFTDDDKAVAVIVARQDCVMAGLPLIDQVLQRLPGPWTTTFSVSEGDVLNAGTEVAIIRGPTRKLLKAERVILNLLSRLSGIATLTRRFRRKLTGTGVRLLDTRKTTPGLRYPEKYAVLVGGGENHRLSLRAMLMLKDNHIDQCGSITEAVASLKKAYDPCPPIEVECRTLTDVREAALAGVQRIMLDNMDIPEMKKALEMIPQGVESEISGRVGLDNIQKLAALKPTYISSGSLTHSAGPIDLSMKIEV